MMGMQAFGQSHSGGMARRTASPPGARMKRHARWLHLFGAIAMLIGMFLPLTDVGRAMANPGAFENPAMARAQLEEVSTTAFTQVVVVGDFQGQFGCGGFDIFCPSTQLTNHDGLWTGSFAVPPGSWQWQIIALTQDGQQYAFDSQGQSTQPESFTISDADAGAFFSFDAATQDAEATAVPAVITLSTDAGTYAMAPDGGNYTAIVQAPQDGQISGEVQINGAPTGIPLAIPVEEGPNEVTVDPAGSLVAAEWLGDATLVVSRIDGATGQPVAGGCYELSSNGETVSRACDTDDGLADGSITLTFPSGFTPGSFTLTETSTPDGATPADDLTLDVQYGDNTAELVAGETATEEATEEPTEEGGIDILPGETETPEGDEPTEEVTEEATEAALPGDLIVTLVDANGAPIGGACFQLERDGVVVAEECDIEDNFPFNGNTGFFGVPSGEYTLIQSTAPEGTEPAPDTQVTVPANGEETVTVTAPAPEETPVPEGDIVVLRQDDAGNAVGGACFQLVDASGNTVGEPVCDEDGDLPDDGRIGFFDVPAGDYQLRETRTPDGYETAADTPVTVTADGLAEVQVRSAQVVIEQPTATEEPTVEPTATEAATETPTVDATEEAAPGSLIITLQDANEQPIGGACFELRQGETVLGPICDSDDPFPANGNTGFFGVPSGTYTLVQTTVPDGTQPIQEQEVTVPANGEDRVFVTAPAAEATEKPTEEPTEEGLVPPAGVQPGTGSVIVDLTGIDQSAGPVCVELNTAGGIEMIGAPSACDNGDGDADGTAGIIRIDGVQPGTYALYVIQGPADLIGAEPLPVTVEDGAEAQVSLTLPTPEPTATTEPTPEPTATPEPGTIEVRFETTAGEPVAEPGGCVTIDGVVSGLCDNAEGDTSTEPGVISVPNVPEGTYTGTVDQAPAGYDAVDASIQAEVAPATTATVGVPVDVAATSFTVTTVDASGTALPNACYSLDEGEAICDDDADGIVTFDGVTPGAHNVAMTVAPIGYTAAEPQPVDVAADGSSTLTFQVAAQTGAVQITTVTAAGDPLVGICYSVDEGEPVCDDGAANVVTIDGLGLGEHSVAQVTTPDGYDVPAAQTVNVTAEAPAALTFQNIRQTGSIAITIVDAESAPLAGACVTVDGSVIVCDNGDGDANLAEGTIQLDGMLTGDRSVAVTSVPEGYDLPAEAQTASVVANEVASLTFTVSPTPPTTGGLDVTVQFEDETIIEGICVVATNTTDNSVLGPICDGGDGDTNDGAGIIGFSDVPAGVYLVSLADGTEIEGGDVANTVPQSVEVLAGERPATTLSVPRVPTTGSIRIVTTDGTATIPGAAYTLTRLDESASVAPSDVVTDVTLAQDPFSITVTDNDGTNDVDGTEGVIQVDGLEPGTYNVSMTTTPEGFQTPADSQVPVTAGEISSVEVAVTPVAEPGAISVRTVNTADENLSGACYAVEQGGTRIAVACDTDDGTNDGVTAITGLDAGSYQLIQTRTPDRTYAAAPAQAVSVAAGETTNVVVENQLRPGGLTILTVDEADRTVQLSNACYELRGDTTFGPFCDADDGAVDGRVTFTNVPAGEYTLVQTVPPSGFQVAAERSVTIQAAGTLQITVANAAIPEPEAVGQLVVIPLSPNGAEVEGGCYQVFDGDRPVTDRLCDNADDVPRRIIFNNVPVGEWTVVEHLAPSPEYVIADPMTVTIVEGERTDLFVEHQFKSGRLLVRAINSTGNPLSNACFDLSDDGLEAQCTGANGEILFSDQAPGVRSLAQTQAPFGYRLDETPREVRINPGQTTVIQVVFESAPPPNTGTVQVQKFFCPAGEDGERTQFLGGAQGNAQLQQTANCTPGAASFTLEPEDASDDNYREFSTTAEGRYQLTVEEGIYVLTETNPDLPGSSAARLRVGVGQMTTVIVINYVAPPEPEPATVNVSAFTCPPSFNGTTFGDFANSCTSDAARTNQITVRVEGESRFKAVTGDGGQVGVTSLTDIPAGSYQIYAEKPHSVPLMYMFCGASAEAPADYKVINGTVRTDLSNGETINCQIFLIPEQVSAETGAILVQKYSCPIDAPVKGYDFQGECSRSEEQVVFEIAVFNAEMQDFEPLVQVTANPDGIVRFPNLRPGTYKLTEVDAKWCFAQSNSVNAEGNVVVQANRLSEVWVYNCVGTQSPPNTGSGDAAGLLDGESDGLPFIGPVVSPPDLRSVD